MMSRVVGTAAIYLAATVLARAGTLLLIPLYTRRLSVDEYGDYALAQTLFALLPTPLSLGMHAAIPRVYFEGAGDEGRRKAGSVARWLIVITALLTSVALVGVMLLTSTGRRGIAGRWELSCVVFGAGMSCIAQLPPLYLRTSQRPLAASAFQLSDFVVSVTAGLLLVHYLDRGLRGAIEVAALAATVSGAIALVFVAVAMRGPLDRTILRRALRFSLPFVPHAAGNQLQGIADRWTMKIVGLNYALGGYALASQLSVPVSMAIAAWNEAASPRLGEVCREAGMPGVARAFRAHQRSYVLVAFAVAIPLCLAIPVIRVFMGPSYFGALGLIPLICGTIVIESFYFPSHVVMLYANKTDAIPKITVVAGVVNVGLNLALIPLYGIYGAIGARALSMTLRSVAMWARARKERRAALARAA
jgi:O-antigen/teichoic acid export membrane protein